MNYLAPPIYDVSNIDMCISKSPMIACLSCHYQESYVSNDKYLGANAQIINALKHTLSKEHISLISHCDSTFTVWNTLTSPKEQTTNVLEKEFIGDESDQACFMVQGNDSLEVFRILN